MSRYEWERGEFKIPSAEWASTKAAVRDAINRKNAEMLQTALKLYERILPKVKGRKPHEFETIAREEMKSLNGGGYYSAPKFGEQEENEIIRSVVDGRYDSKKQSFSYRLKKPLKKDFPQHGNNVTEFAADDCSVVFDNGARTLTWTVHENNHAVEHARGTPLGKAVFAALEKVKWTRGTGGTILGNDEYNRDAGRDYEGGGGSYSKEAFGPDVKHPSRAPAVSNWGFRRF